MIVQPRLGIAYILAEAQHDAELFGLDAIKTGHRPAQGGGDQDDKNAEPAEIPAGQPPLKPVLGAPQKVFKVGGPWSHRLRAGAPRSFRTRAPGASALILPRHQYSPPRAPGSGCPGARSGWLYRGRPRPLQRKLPARR